MASQRVVLLLPEQPPTNFLALAMDLRSYFEARGYVVSIRYGAAGFDDDVTPIDGATLPALAVAVSVMGGQPTVRGDLP